MSAKRPSRRVSVSLSPKLDAMIDELLASGLFGRNRADVIHRLICDRLIKLTEEGWLAMPGSD